MKATSARLGERVAQKSGCVVAGGFCRFRLIGLPLPLTEQRNGLFDSEHYKLLLFIKNDLILLPRLQCSIMTSIKIVK